MTPPDLAPELRAARALPRMALGDAWAARTADDGAVMMVALAREVASLAPDPARLVAALRACVRTGASAGDDALLPLLDVHVAPDGRVVLVLPLEERAPAAERLGRGKAFATREVADAARVLARALGAAHGRGERHGAACAGLLYLGDGRPPRLAGAGLVEAFVEAGAERGALLATLGARAVAAPEAAGPAGGATTAADVYALGATLYACMTGKPPFGGRTTSVVMAAVLADEGLSGEMQQLPRGDAAVLAAHAEASERLTLALLRAVERAPEDRWPSMTEFARAVDVRVPTPPETPVPAAALPSRGAARRIARGMLAGALLLALAALAAGAAAMLR